MGLRCRPRVADPLAERGRMGFVNIARCESQGTDSVLWLHGHAVVADLQLYPVICSCAGCVVGQARFGRKRDHKRICRSCRYEDVTDALGSAAEVGEGGVMAAVFAFTRTAFWTPPLQLVVWAYPKAAIARTMVMTSRDLGMWRIGSP